MPELPAFSYSMRELRRLCQAATRAVGEITLADRRVTVHRVLADGPGEGLAGGVHTHSFYEGILVLRGSAEYTTEAPQWLSAGHVLLLPPFTPHAWRVPDGECLRLVLEFTIDPPVRVQPPAHWPCWPEVLWDIAVLLDDLVRQPRQGFLLVTPRLSAVLARLLTLGVWPAGVPDSAAEPMQFMEVVETFLADNLAQPITVADVAGHVGMSERSLLRHFRQTAGSTIIERLFELRMDHAATLLVDTDLSVAEVAARCGIPDPSYFCSRFRRHFRLAPLQYRRQASRPPA
jgi:AraC-like DNA-binding protein